MYIPWSPDALHRQTNLALRLSQSGQRVHHEKDVRSFVAEVFRNRARHQGCADPKKRRLIPRGHHHHRSRKPLRAEGLVEKVTHLPPPLPDQADDADIGGGVAGNRSDKGRLADPGSGEDSNALALTDGDERIDDAHPRRKRLLDSAAGQGRGGRRVERAGHHIVWHCVAVNRPPQTVDHPPQQRAGERYGLCVAFRVNEHARRDAVVGAKEHDDGTRAVEPDHFAAGHRLQVPR